MEQGWLARNHLSSLVQPLECDRGPKVLLRTMRQQVSRHVLPEPSKAVCPPQHSDLVVVAFAVDVSARLDQQSDRFQIAVHRCEMKRRCVVRKVAAIEVGPTLDEQAQRRVLIAQGREMQRGRLLTPPCHRVNELRMLIEMGAQLGTVT